MKKIIGGLFIIVFSFALISCHWPNIDDDNGDPIGIGDEIPTAVVVESENNINIIEEEETLQLTATVYPLTASQEVVWSSNAEHVAAVDTNGLVTGIKAGTVMIKAFAGDKDDIVGSFYLTVTAKPVPPITANIIGPSSLYHGETIKYSYEVTPENATPEPEWSTDNQDIISVDDNGRVIGLQPGEADLILKIGNIVNRKTITVQPRVIMPQSLDIIGRSEVEVGHLIPLRLEVTPYNAINDVIWMSSDNAIATVDEYGRVAGLAAGTVTITVSSVVDDNLVAAVVIEVFDYTITGNQQKMLIDTIALCEPSVLGVANYQFDSDNQLNKHSIGSGAVYDVWFKLQDGSLVYDIDEIVIFDEVEKYCYYVMTNRHVVKDSDAVKIYLSEEDCEVDAVVRQFDDDVDLAVIYFEYNRYIRPLPLGDSDALPSGTFVVAIGNPSGFDFSGSATYGIISYPKRYLSEDTDGDGTDDWDGEYIQHDVAINPGNSGGPLLNLKGEIIGINTLKFASVDIDNMGFSIPSNLIVNILPVLETGEKPNRPELGVTVQEVKSILAITPGDTMIPDGIEYGLYVIAVADNSIAQTGGILVDDIILSFNGINIYKTLDLRLELNSIVVGSGQSIPVEIYRNGEIITIFLEF